MCRRLEADIGCEDPGLNCSESYAKFFQMGVNCDSVTWSTYLTVSSSCAAALGSSQPLESGQLNEADTASQKTHNMHHEEQYLTLAHRSRMNKLVDDVNEKLVCPTPSDQSDTRNNRLTRFGLSRDKPSRGPGAQSCLLTTPTTWTSFTVDSAGLKTTRRPPTRQTGRPPATVIYDCD